MSTGYDYVHVFEYDDDDINLVLNRLGTLLHQLFSDKHTSLQLHDVFLGQLSLWFCVRGACSFLDRFRQQADW